MIMNELVNLKLPEFAFLDANVFDVDELKGRNLILHIPSMSIVEIFDRGDVVLNENVITHKFSYTNLYSIKEPMISALHLCSTYDREKDIELIKNKVLIPTCLWFCRYQKWEDKNIERNGLS